MNLKLRKKSCLKAFKLTRYQVRFQTAISLIMQDCKNQPFLSGISTNKSTRLFFQRIAAETADVKAAALLIPCWVTLPQRHGKLAKLHKTNFLTPSGKEKQVENCRQAWGLEVSAQGKHVSLHDCTGLRKQQISRIHCYFD